MHSGLADNPEAQALVKAESSGIVESDAEAERRVCSSRFSLQPLDQFSTQPSISKSGEQADVDQADLGSGAADPPTAGSGAIDFDNLVAARAEAALIASAFGKILMVDEGRRKWRGYRVVESDQEFLIALPYGTQD